MTRFPHALSLGVAASLVATSAALAAAPQAALNKTVTVTWGTSGTGVSETGQSRSFNNINTRTIYISSAGRTFLRMRLRGTKVERGAERGPGDTSGGSSVRIDGNRLIGVESFQSGARQWIATFDPSFSSCSLSVIDAKAGGANIKRRGPDGAMWTLSNVTTSAPSCSVQSGNALGGSE